MAIERLVSAFIASLLLVVSACSRDQSPQPARVQPMAPETGPAGPRWLSVDLPGQYSAMRSDQVPAAVGVHDLAGAGHDVGDDQPCAHGGRHRRQRLDPSHYGRLPGVTKLNPSTGSLTQFPFPVVVVYYERRPTPSPGQCSMPHSCMPVVCRTILVFRCTPTAVSLDPGVQQMAPDADGNVWMVTSASSTTLQGNRNPMAPVVELEANSP
jgi:hypothetical protein